MATTLLIVHEEIDTCKLMQSYISKYFNSISEILIANNVENAIALFYNHKPSIILLNVDLNVSSKFNFLDVISNYNPYTILLTSYEETPLRVLDYNIKGYILKPLELEKFIKEISLALNAIKLSTNYDVNIFYNDVITICSLTKYEVFNIDDIIYLEADGRYTTFYLADNNKKISTINIGVYEQFLDKKKFIRIHHKYIINIKWLSYIDRNLPYDCVMSNSTILPISKRKVKNVFQFLNIKMENKLNLSLN